MGIFGFLTLKKEKNIIKFDSNLSNSSYESKEINDLKKLYLDKGKVCIEKYGDILEKKKKFLGIF